MDKQTFEHRMNRAKTMKMVEPEKQDYWRGYIRGLRRTYHDESFGTLREHKLWLSAAGDEIREERSRGYRDGLRE